MTGFLSVLKEKQAIVWPEIRKYLNQLSDFPPFCRIPKKYLSQLQFHQKLMSDYPKRKGKYFRPTLLLLTAEALGFPQEKAVKTAAAMQVSEEWILIHDDIEDDSVQRRGGPTLHRIYGKELAINAGDALHILMWRILWDNVEVVGLKKAARVADEFYLMLSRTVLGQTVEIRWTKERRSNLSDKDILFILESKTGYYTVAGPMRLGAILAGATQLQLEKIYEFGKLLGYCFQIKDDLLDLTSDFEGRKQRGNDIYEGKRTIMLMHLFRKIRGREKKHLRMIMEKTREEKTAEEVDWVIRMMERYGSLEYAQNLAERFAQRTKEFFSRELSFLKRQPARNQLLAGVDFVLNRKY